MKWREATIRYTLTALGLGVVVLWGWSAFFGIGHSWRDPDDSETARLVQLEFGCLTYEEFTDVRGQRLTLEGEDHVFGHLAAIWWGFRNVTYPADWYVRVPLWPAALVFMAGAAVAWHRWARLGVRRNAGSCGHCGYDRTGLAADAKCPECGTVPAPAAK